MSERIQRLVFGEVAEEYERHRPDYPGALIDELVMIAGVGPGDPALEIGAGTGKATRHLLWRGLDVTALEPDPAMVAVARRHAPGATFVTSGFEDWPLVPDHFAVVVAAQSWHWVDDEIGPRKAAEALRPGGWITLMWNRPDLDACAWHDDLQPIYKRITPGMEHNIRKSFSSSLPPRSSICRRAVGSEHRFSAWCRGSRATRPTSTSRSSTRTLTSACCRTTNGRRSSTPSVHHSTTRAG